MRSAMKFFILTVLVITIIDQSIGGRCSNPRAYSGKVVADPWGTFSGECVSFYKTCSGDHRSTSQWKRGPRVKNAKIRVGTGIASFTNGDRFVGSNCNRPKKCGHVAIYVGQNSQGIQVWDQWRGQPVHQRTLSFGTGNSSNNGDDFYVIN
ncbi:domesticated amidase effector 2-like [Daphnia carinata]|uniref:domesticated amidase effector 2-like n=1 Tax=Daphnia carinata TaxID=120202 RepID=UPI00257BF28B|nr:domesticated amidase effector 2-like [Daphnia carinata]